MDNGSATIEALGNGNINTQRLWNHDLHLITGEHHQDQRISEYALIINPSVIQVWKDGLIVITIVVVIVILILISMMVVHVLLGLLGYNGILIVIQ
ncbi:hypothetical protein INT80_00805 [Gallibacterium anatis]|uniref:Uncharacterized protein n=1 Tax=Gallibacterium anatis TaxID=750 RepID=A0A930UV83_9PAST|nr:hypothetical protein [Gallibacterium anatis]